MTVFYTSNHDMSLVSSPTELVPTDYEIAEMQAELDSELETIQREINSDSWVDDMMMGILEDIQY